MPNKKFIKLPPYLRRRQRGFVANKREFDRYLAAAKARGLSLSEFIRVLLDREIAQVDGAYGFEREKQK